MKTNSISVYLISGNYMGDYSRFVVDDCRGKKIVIDDGELYYRIKENGNYPAWVEGFFGETKLDKNKEKFKIKSVAAVYFTSIDWRGKSVIFAVAFGVGRYLIKQEFITREFGLKTSCHAIDTLRISSMNTITYDSGIKKKTIQSVSEIPQNDFFLNADTDVLAAVKGKTRDNLTSELLKDRTIGGRDSVSMSAKVDVSNIKEFLHALYSQYKNSGTKGVRYKSNIIKLTTDKTIRCAEKLLESFLLSKDRSEHVFFNLPLEEIREGVVVSGYQLDPNNVVSNLTDEIFNEFNTVQRLKQKKVIVKFEAEGQPELTKNLFQFVYAEIESDAESYILADGQFYKIDSGYKKTVENYYNKVVETDKIQNLCGWNGEDEGTFNSQQTSANILVMDKEIIHPKSTDKFEFCDLLTSEKQIVHTKIFGVASQPLTYLFNQGLVSAKCMFDKTIRCKINAVIRKVQEKSGKENDFTIADACLGNYTVTFLILCKDQTRIGQGDRPKIPFLAKLVFRENAIAIRNLGYKVKIIGKVKENH